MDGNFGGIANKFGNRYEALWVVRKLIQVLSEELNFLTLERIGNDSEGVDLWVSTKDGNSEAQQCKCRNGAAGRWSLSDLHQRGVLGTLMRQLRRGEHFRFQFISGDPAPDLSDLCHKAAFANNGEELVLSLTSDSSRKAFSAFCSYLHLDEDDASAPNTAHNFLARTSVHLFDHGPVGRQDVHSLVNSYIAGDPKTVVEVLSGLANDSINKPLHADQIRNRLQSARFQIRDLAHDSRVGPAVESLQHEFIESLRPHLINEELIPRDASKDLIDWITDAQGPQLAIVKGAKGRGKSTVLLEFVQHMQAKGIPFLPLRLDRRRPEVNARRFGETVCGLPESPALCLRAYAGDRSGVLILDQLDALRWTNAHASVSVSVLKEVIAQVIQSRNLKVIVVCRTFDLLEDPQLKALLGGVQGKIIEVGDLPAGTVEQIVARHGEDPSKLTVRQKELLKRADLLAIWVKIRKAQNDSPRFAAESDLMREFFKSLRIEAGKLDLNPSEFNQALDELVTSISRTEWLFANRTCISQYPQAESALQSLGVIVLAQNRFSFCHQGYFEYLLAEQGFRSLRSGSKSIVEWIGAEQSLLRREPLRQLLLLLRDDDPKCFEDSIRGILENPRTRFHIKHLAIQIIAFTGNPQHGEINLILELLASSEWHDNVVRLLVGKPAWFRILFQHSILDAWLDSGEPERLNDVRWMAYNVAADCGDEIARLLQPRLQGPQSNQIVALITRMLPLDPSADSRSLFEIRLGLIRRGVQRFILESLDLRKLSSLHPVRCIEIVEAFLEAHLGQTNNSERPSRRPTHPDEALPLAATRAPKEAWRRLMPLIERLAEHSIVDEKEEHFVVDTFWTEHYGDYRHVSVVLDALVAGGKALSETDSREFWLLIEKWSTSRFLVIQRLLLKVIGKAPVTEADRAIRWLLADPRRISVGEPMIANHWALSRRLIDRHAAHSSQAVYEQLEAFVTEYSEKWERRSFKSAHERVMKGDYSRPNDWGSSRYALLSCLPGQRLSDYARCLRGQLERKFGPYDKSSDTRRAVGGGFIGSTLREAAQKHLSIRQWKEIIHPTRPWNVHRRRGGGRIGYRESSPEQFSRTLEAHAWDAPSQYASLALEVVEGADKHYVCAILEALSKTEPPPQLEPARRDLWCPATIADVEKVILRIGYVEEAWIATSVCRLIARRANEDWSEAIVSLICRFAIEHPNPPPQALAIMRNEHSDGVESVPDLETTSLNCVRGCAAHVITALLFANIEMLEPLMHAIASLAADPNPAVRVAAMETCLPILNISRDDAVSTFLAICDSDNDLILTSHYVWEFFRYTWKTHLHKLQPLLSRMLGSSLPKAESIGSRIVTGIHLYSGELRDEFGEVKDGNQTRRAAAAQVAVECVQDDIVADTCAELLNRYLDDPESEVRACARRAILGDDILDSKHGPTLARAFVKSQAFQDDPSPLLYALENCIGSLRDYSDVIVQICQCFVGPLREAAQNIQTSIAGDVMMIPKLILRLYDEAEQLSDRGLRDQCLDSFDEMLKADLAMSRDLLQGLNE